MTSPPIVLSQLQHEAALSVERWFNNGKPDKPFFYLAGYAGTGKTSIALQLAKMLRMDDPDGDPVKFRFAAFSGKASLVLSRKGCTPSSTIHRLIYKMNEREKGEPISFTRRDKMESTPDLLILDECSMVNEEIGLDLLHFGVPILVLGDPGQLPPVEGTGYFTQREPDFLLTEIHRQAEGSPIIQLATFARKQQHLPLGAWGQSVVSNGAIHAKDMFAFDQVICGTNRTRTHINRSMRQELGHTSQLPVVGDKLICLRNNWDVDGMMNGALWRVTFVGTPSSGGRFTLCLQDWDEPSGESQSVETHSCFFGVGSAPIGKEWRGLTQLTFGYAITCHKSQGSQWDSVLLINESHCFREDSAKWLYTGITRAAERITILM